MNFCWVMASFKRSTTSAIVNLRSLGGLMVTDPVGLTVRMGVRPLSLENHSRTSSQFAEVKLTVTVFSVAAAAWPGVGRTLPGEPGAGIGLAAGGAGAG